MYEITSYQFIDNKKDNLILFLHGWGCNSSYFLSLANKIKFANSLIIDLPGFGKNKELEKPFNIADFVECIIKLINKNNYKVSYIVGHSFGGKLAVCIAKKINVKGLFLLAPSIYHKRRYPSYYIKVGVYKLIKRIRFLQFLLPFFGSKDYKDCSDVMKKTMSNIINESIEKQLISLSIPIIVFFGNNDKITPIYLGKRIVRKSQDASLIILNGDHFAYLYNELKIIKIIESLVNFTCK